MLHSFSPPVYLKIVVQGMTAFLSQWDHLQTRPSI